MKPPIMEVWKTTYDYNWEHSIYIRGSGYWNWSCHACQISGICASWKDAMQALQTHYNARCSRALHKRKAHS